MEFISRYVSHVPDAQGNIAYTPEENGVWTSLFERQEQIIKQRACDEFIEGLRLLGIKSDAIPQLPAVNRHLKALTGWTVSPVDALISARAFFELLASKQFPAATFIRTREELNYVKEPDIFHELFGHCPMLTNPIFANFLEGYAIHVLAQDESEWALYQRLFWFTVEFGLIQTKQGLRAYGGGILSSISETPYSIESDIPMRALFDPVSALRTPYRIDQLQPIYFVIPNYETLYQVIEQMPQAIQRARALGEFPPFFALDPNNPSIHILAC